jgi:uncharacterized membrane protein YjgN (DUF898 family)
LRRDGKTGSIDSMLDTAITRKAARESARFLGDDRDYWRLMIRGAILLMVTLGLYRFWLATDMRRFLWSNSEVSGEGLEYVGTPLELLLGFLVAITLLVPLYGVFFVAALDLGLLGELSSVLAFLLLAFLGQFAIYRARRYRLTRTIYRGIRFRQTGAAWRYAVCAVFWWTMIILTLGLAYPWAQARLEQRKMDNTFYGDLPGHFESSGWSLFIRGFPLWCFVTFASDRSRPSRRSGPDRCMESTCASCGTACCSRWSPARSAP